MSETMNSREFWETFFQEQWEKNEGPSQTRHFMQKLVANLPPQVGTFLREGMPSVLDWGCAFGDGVEVLQKAYSNLRAAGLDFSAQAIEEARRRHKGFKFLHSDSGAIPEEFDVVVTSNCLEHFHDPMEILKSHLPQVRFLYILLVPLNEYPLSEYHFAQFRRESFPEWVGGFFLLDAQEVTVDPSFWNGPQILVTYTSPQFRQWLRGKKSTECELTTEGEQIEILETANAELRKQLTQEQAEGKRRAGQLETLQTQIAELKADQTLQSGKMAELYGELEGIYRSRGWALVMILRHLGRVCLPPGSWRSRLARKLLQK